MNKFILKTLSLALLCSVAASCNGSADKADKTTSSTFADLTTVLEKPATGELAALQPKLSDPPKFDALNMEVARLATDIAGLTKDLGDSETLKALKSTLAELRKDLDATKASDADAIKILAEQIAKLDALLTSLQPMVNVETLRPVFQFFTPGSGNFELRESSRIIIDSKDDALVRTLNAPMGWIQKLRYATGLKLDIVASETAVKGDIILSARPDKALLDKAETAKVEWAGESRSIKEEVLKEGYTYKADSSNLTLTYKSEVGAIRALQSVYQLVAGDRRAPGFHRFLPVGQGLDYPLFGFRGIMLDVGRQFVSVPDLIGFMDKMSYYKLNVLHLHLSDNVGDGTAKDASEKLILPQAGPNGYVRLYDDSMPESLKVLKPKDSPSDGDDRTYYTKGDIKKLEEAAKRYGMEILPEIDTPGHSYAITNVFPHFASPANRSVIDVKNPEAVKYVADAMTEFSSWFSTKKFHIGGDEAYGTQGDDLNQYLESLKIKLLAKGIGSEMLGVWNNYNHNRIFDKSENLSKDFTIFNWVNSDKLKKSGQRSIDVSDGRYFVPYFTGDYFNPGGLTADQTFAVTASSWTKSGLPSGGETAVWNDFGEKYDYGFETINAGIVRSLPALGYAYWSGIPVDATGKARLYSSLKAENITAAREYTSTWLREKFPKLTGSKALDILLETANHRTFTIAKKGAIPILVAAPSDTLDPMGWDPLDMAAAFKRAQEETASQASADKGLMHLQ